MILDAIPKQSGESIKFRIYGDGRIRWVCVCTSYKYIILCEEVGVHTKTIISGGPHWGQFAFHPLNKGSDDTLAVSPLK